MEESELQLVQGHLLALEMILTSSIVAHEDAKYAAKVAESLKHGLEPSFTNDYLVSTNPIAANHRNELIQGFLTMLNLMAQRPPTI
jgi:hypothetical protein